MLLKHAILEGIAAGTVTLAFRRWRRPSVKAGGRLRTAAGVLAIEAVEPIVAEAISDADAVHGGFAGRAALLRELGVGDDDGQTLVYRVAIRFAGPDPRVALRDAAELDGEAATALGRSLARLDRASSHGAWTKATLALIDARPGVRAADLARALGRDTTALKRDIRKLKELGLTESIDTGYRLAPRGRAYLETVAPEASRQP